MRDLGDLSRLGDVLLHNAIVFGVAFVLLLILAQAVLSVLLRFSNHLLGWSVLEISEATRQELRRRLRRTVLLIVFVLLIGLAGGATVASWRGLWLGALLRARLLALWSRDPIGLGLGLGKAIAVIALVWIGYALVRAILRGLRTRLGRIELLARRQDKLAELLERLRLLLRFVALFTALLGAARILELEGSARQLLWQGAYLFCAFYAARFGVSAAHLAVDVFFDLSEALDQVESPLKYLARLRHLGPLTKRSIDYFIYVGTATWVCDQLTPGTWLSAAGRIGIRIIAIFYISRVLVELCLVFINELFLTRGPEHTEAEFQQRQTLVPVASSILRYGVYFAAVVMVLREAGMDPTPLLAGAGIVGVAVGLGAQAFVGDVVGGFFILFENLFLVGDLIEASGVKGHVEEIGVRVTKLRDQAGILHAIPNGEMRKVSSHSKGYVNAVIDLLVPYEEDLAKVAALITDKAAALRRDEPTILDDTEISIEDLRESAVLLRTRTRVKPGMDEDMTDRLRAAFLEALRTASIAAPHARRVVLIRSP